MALEVRESMEGDRETLVDVSDGLRFLLRTDRSRLAGMVAGVRRVVDDPPPFRPSPPLGTQPQRDMGCIVSLTTPIRSSLRASRSVSSLRVAEKASKVFLASYFLL